MDSIQDPAPPNIAADRSDGRTLRWFRSSPGFIVLGISFLPNLTCPACWPAYAGVFSSLGLGPLASSEHLLAVTVVFLLFGLGVLAFGARRRRAFGPLMLGVLASALILVGKFFNPSDRLTYCGAGLFVAASLWNARGRVWHGRSCQKCATSESIPIAIVPTKSCCESKTK